MRYRRLGRTGLSISEIALGTMNFGSVADRAESFRIMDAAHDSGVNFFDTGIRYGGDGPHGFGVTEEVLGEWFGQGGGRRERTVLSTKVFQPIDGWPNNQGLSALNIRRCCEHSLRRLNTDYIDVFVMHHIDRSTPWPEIWQAMEVLVQQGKVLYVGSSNFAGWHIAQAQAAADQRGLLGLASEQSLYNLMVRDIEREVIPAVTALGLGLLTWSPLNGGLLGGVLRKQREGTGRRTGWAGHTIAAHADRLQAYEDLCAAHGLDPALVGVAWLLHQPAVTAPVIGPSSVAQLASTLGAAELSLTEDFLAELDRIFPGYQTAPEDYAW